MDAATFTPDSLNSPSLTMLAGPIWLATQQERKAKFHGGFLCPTRTAPYGMDDPDGNRAHEHCHSVGCLDLHHELITRVLEKLRRLDPVRARAVDNVEAYVYRVAGTELIEWNRALRTARGFPAKPTRSDGIPGRIIDALALHPGGPWLVTLFRIMRSYPFSLHHISGRWPVLGLAQEKSVAQSGREVPLDEIRQDIRLVEAIAKRTASPAWVYANLTLPLMANSPSVELLHEHHARSDADPADAVLIAMLRSAYALHRAEGDDPSAAFVAAAREVSGRELVKITPEISEAIADFESTSVR